MSAPLTPDGRAVLATSAETLEEIRRLRRENYDGFMRENHYAQRVELDLLKVKAGELSPNDVVAAPSEVELELGQIRETRRANPDAFWKNAELVARERELLERMEGS